MKAARRRISGDGDLENGWNRLSALIWLGTGFEVRGPGFDEKLGAVEDSRLGVVGARFRAGGGLEAIECHLGLSHRRDDVRGLDFIPPPRMCIRHR